MNSLLAYSGLVTKVRAMKSRLLTEEEFEEIQNLHSVSEVVSYLSVHPGYAHLFESVDIAMIHRGNLEKILTLSRYRDFSKLYHFATIKQRKFLRLFFLKYEVGMLKTVLRQIYERQSVSIDFSILGPYFEQYSSISLTALSEATSVEQFLEALKGTIFYPPLRRVYELGNAGLFDYELCLDVLQFTSVWKNKGKYLCGKDLEIVTDDYGYRIDILNIQWIYRVKNYYNSSTADIYSFLIPICYKLKKSQIQELVAAENSQDFYSKLQNTYYGRILAPLLESEQQLSPEHMYHRLLEWFHRRSMRSSPYSFACIENYFYMKQKEISKLITITECIRYSYTVDEMQDIL